MLYCDKPDWCGCTDEQVKKLAEEIKKQTEGRESLLVGDVEIYEDCGTIHAWYDYENGKVSNIEVGLEWADRDGDCDIDAAIKDNAAAEKLAKILC